MGGVGECTQMDTNGPKCGDLVPLRCTTKNDPSDSKAFRAGFGGLGNLGDALLTRLLNLEGICTCVISLLPIN